MEEEYELISATIEVTLDKEQQQLLDAVQAHFKDYKHKDGTYPFANITRGEAFTIVIKSGIANEFDSKAKFFCNQK